MDAATYDWVTRLVADCLENDDLNDWEHNFIKDQEVRLRSRGVDTPYTAKQWAVLDKLANKIEFEERPDSDQN